METHSSKFKIRLGLLITGGLALFVLAVFIIGKQKNLFDRYSGSQLLFIMSVVCRLEIIFGFPELLSER